MTSTSRLVDGSYNLEDVRVEPLTKKQIAATVILTAAAAAVFLALTASLGFFFPGSLKKIAKG